MHILVAIFVPILVSPILALIIVSILVDLSDDDQDKDRDKDTGRSPAQRKRPCSGLYTLGIYTFSDVDLQIGNTCVSLSAFSTNDGTGSPGGTWFPCPASSADRLSSLEWQGRTCIDDLRVSDPTSVTARGTPVEWLLDHVGPQADYDAADLQDHDGDHAPTGDEFLAGTDPASAASVLAVIDVERDGITNVVRWFATATHDVDTPVTMYRSTDLNEAAWSPVASNLARQASGTNTWRDAAPPPGCPSYYRPAFPVTP